MKITQKAIAKKAGVSQSTVSFILNNRLDISISEATREHVRKVIQDYRARSPESILPRKTGNIAYLIPHSASYEDPFYHRFFVGVRNAAEDVRYHVFVTTYHDSSSIPDIVVSGKIDGLVVQGKNTDNGWLKRIAGIAPLVLLNQLFEDNLVDSVMPDNAGGVRKTVTYLHGLGHQRIAFFSAKPLLSHHQERFDGYVSVMRDLRLDVRPEYVRLPEPTDYGNSDEIDRYAREALSFWRSLGQPPTAVVASADSYALPLIRAAQIMKVSVPHDLSIAGFDSTQGCLLVSPRLTSVNQPMETMGSHAVRTLLDRINGQADALHGCVRFETQVSIQESTGPCRERGSG